MKMENHNTMLLTYFLLMPIPYTLGSKGTERRHEQNNGKEWERKERYGSSWNNTMNGIVNTATLL